MAREILIADSDKANQEEFQKVFETTDYHLVFSESGEDVLLRVKLFKPDLIIAGRALSEKDGFWLCEAIKGDPEFRSIPFVLLLSMPEELREKDKKGLKPDGVLSKPLREGEVLNMVDRLLEGMKTKGTGIAETEAGWGSPRNTKKENLLLDESAEKGDDEVIDLLDVVEEAEPRMSIDDFAIAGKEEPLGEITPLESWDKLEGEEKLAAEEGFVLSLREEEEEKEEMPPRLRKEPPPKEPPQEEELFEKIELEDILEKVVQTEPAAETELSLEKRVGALEQEFPAAEKEPEEKLLDLMEFETLLKKGVEAESPKEEPLEEMLQPFSFEEQKADVGEEITPIEIPEEELEESERLVEEGLPKGLLEEALEEVRAEGVEGLEEEEPEGFEEEELEELEEETLETLEEEALEGFDAEDLEVVEELGEAEEPKEERIELFEGLEAPQTQEEPMRMIEESRPVGIERQLEEAEARRLFEDEVGFPPRRMDQQMGEVLSERVRGMMEEFITKHVPEMTKDLVGLTIERIEKMVKEIVPDLAERMIEEEIKRLEKGEKD